MMVKLPKIVEEAGFSLTENVPGVRFHRMGFGDVDLSKLTPKTAERLYQQGLPYLIKKQPEKKPSAVKQKGKK